MPNKHVLVVEDDDTIRRLLVEYLRQHAFTNVDGARDGVDALHKIQHHRYRVVVLDLMMPLMSGVDFLDSLTAMTSDPSLNTIAEPPSVIIVTSMTDTDVSSETLKQRSPLVKSVFRKPVDVEGLAIEVERELRS
jgi:CheY-like chemotaxis protein